MRKSADNPWDWVKKNSKKLGRIGLNIAITSAAVAIGAAMCGATAGVACVIAATVAVSMPMGLTSNLLYDKAVGHKTSGSEAVGYLVGSIWKGAQGAALRNLKREAWKKEKKMAKKGATKAWKTKIRPPKAKGKGPRPV